MDLLPLLQVITPHLQDFLGSTAHHTRPVVAFDQCPPCVTIAMHCALLRNEHGAATTQLGSLSRLWPATHQCPTCRLHCSPGHAGTWLHTLLAFMAPMHPPGKRMVPSCHCAVTSCSCRFRFSLSCCLVLATLAVSAARLAAHTHSTCVQFVPSGHTVCCASARAPFLNLFLHVGSFLMSGTCAPWCRSVLLVSWKASAHRSDGLVRGVAGAPSSGRVFPLSTW